MSNTQMYSQDWFSIIEQSRFLSDDDMNELSLMKDELQDTFEKKQMWRTETEMRISVLDDLHHPTKASKYWQSIREQSVFFENLVTLSFEYRREVIKTKQLERKLENETDDLERELILIDIEESNFKKKNMEIASKDRMREIKLWSKIKKELDDWTFDTKDVNNHQLISLTKSFIIQKMVSGDSWSPSERQNLEWLLKTSIDHCIENNCLDKVLIWFPEEVQKLIKSWL